VVAAGDASVVVVVVVVVVGVVVDVNTVDVVLSMMILCCW